MRNMLRMEINRFLARKERERQRAAARAAAFKALGMDVGQIALHEDETRAICRERLLRRMRRERLRGLCDDPAYDLERHIRLKKALEEFVG